MASTLESTFIDYSARKLEQLSGRIADCLGRLTPEQIWTRGSQNENAVGNLVLHLRGNVRQWIVSGLAGKPDTRERDAEFLARGGAGSTELAEKLRVTVDEATEIIRNFDRTRLAAKVTIQEYEVTSLEAIYHVIEHFAQHTGQIIFSTKQMTGEDLGYYRHLGGRAHAEQTP